MACASLGDLLICFPFNGDLVARSDVELTRARLLRFHLHTVTEILHKYRCAVSRLILSRVILRLYCIHNGCGATNPDDLAALGRPVGGADSLYDVHFAD